MRLAFLLIVATVQVQAVAAQELPRISVMYQAPDGSIFDRDCPRIIKAEVDAQWIRETVTRRDEFQRVWDAEGREYLRTALNEIGAPFPFSEMQATLTVCPGVDSMSDPLLVNVRRFLTDADEPAAVSGFAFLLFHELMHHYVRPVLASSRLRAKYSAESANTQNHLHVLALEKLVLVRLGREAQLERLDASYRTGYFARFRPAYRRAWEIVNDIEGYEAFVQELKAAPRLATQP